MNSWLSVRVRLCDPTDCSPPGSSVHGILRARILEWVAFPFSKGSSGPRDWTHASCVSCIAGRFFSQVSHQGNLIFYLPRWFRRLFLSPECAREALGNLRKVQKPTVGVGEGLPQLAHLSHHAMWISSSSLLSASGALFRLQISL